MSKRENSISSLYKVRLNAGHIMKDSYCEDDCGEACFGNQD